MNFSMKIHEFNTYITLVPRDNITKAQYTHFRIMAFAGEDVPFRTHQIMVLKKFAPNP